jgi:tRNA pseudouridine38-40 synthase
MVRTLAGTLLAVGDGRLTVELVAEALRSRRRDLAGPTAPAAGLTLVRVDY